MKCKRCGAKIEKGTYFCDKCGQSIGTVSEIQEYMQAESKKKKLCIWSVILAVLIVLGVGYNVFNHMSGGNQTVLSSKPTAEPMQTPQTVLPQNTSEPADNIVAEPTAEPVAEPTVEPTQEPTPEPTAEPVPTEKPAKENVYLYPSDTTEFTREYLESLDRIQARLARNELYARHGMVFGIRELQKYFAKQEWYEPDYDITENQIYEGFSDIERKNHRMIVEYEKEKGWAE